MIHQKQVFTFALVAFICIAAANECTSPLQGPGCHSLGSGLQSIINAFTGFSAELENMAVDAITENEATQTITSSALYKIHNVHFG